MPRLAACPRTRLWRLHQDRFRVGGALKLKVKLCDCAVAGLGVGVKAIVVWETRLRLHADAILEDSVGLNAYSS